MTNEQKDQCAKLMADEIIRIINMFGEVLHVTDSEWKSDEKYPAR